MNIEKRIPAFLFALALLSALSAHSSELADRHDDLQWKIRATGGDVQALYNLGMLKIEGYALDIQLIVAGGQPKPDEFDLGVSYLEDAAKSGHVDAMYMLGRIRERLNPPDFPASERHYRAAAEKGHARAQYELGALYHRGVVPGGDGEALKWFHRAADQGLLKARRHLKMLDMEAEREWRRQSPEIKPEYRWGGGDCHVIYINGIRTSRERFNTTLTLLRMIFDLDGFGDRITLEGVYAPGEGFMELPWTTIHKLTGHQTAAVSEAIWNLDHAVVKALYANKRVIIIGHSRGNLYIHELLSKYPNLGSLVWVIALGSPTLTIKGKNVAYISESRDPVARIGEFTEKGIRISSGILDRLKKSATPLQALKLLGKDADAILTREVKPIYFINPLLYKSVMLLGSDPYLLKLHSYFDPVEWSADKAFDAAFPSPFDSSAPLRSMSKSALRKGKKFALVELIQLLDKLEAHDVIKSYLLGPGLTMFRGVFYKAAGVEKIAARVTPPKPLERYIPSKPKSEGKGIEGTWLQHVNGREAGVYDVYTDENGSYVMTRREARPGSLMPPSDIGEIGLKNDEWTFAFDTGFARTLFRLVRQTPDIYAGIVNGNENRWVRIADVSADTPVEPILEELIEVMDGMLGIPPKDIMPDPDIIEQDPIDNPDSVPDESPDAGLVKEAQSDQSPSGTNDAPPRDKEDARGITPKRRLPGVLAIDPRALVGTWIRMVDERPAFEYTVEPARGRGKVSMRETFSHPGSWSRIESISDIIYTGAEWSFDCLMNGVPIRIYLHRQSGDEFRCVLEGATELWKRKKNEPKTGSAPAQPAPSIPRSKRAGHGGQRPSQEQEKGKSDVLPPARPGPPSEKTSSRERPPEEPLPASPVRGQDLSEPAGTFRTAEPPRPKPLSERTFDEFMDTTIDDLTNMRESP